MKFKRILLPFVLFLTLLPALVTTAVAASKPVTDDFLVDTIRQKLAADTVVKGGAIEVVVKDGAVTLRGNVEEDRQKTKAEKIAKRVSGVKSVVNEIKIAHL
jgi:osmotically-inducible protein OsmY